MVKLFTKIRPPPVTCRKGSLLVPLPKRLLATQMSPSVSSDPSHQWVPAQLDGQPTSSCTTFARPIIQSPNDGRAYRIIKLHNNLQALLVSDPDTDKAAASLSVAVGHLSDPDDRPGLAHFCEHLLFMVISLPCHTTKHVTTDAVRDTCRVLASFPKRTNMEKCVNPFRYPVHHVVLSCPAS